MGKMRSYFREKIACINIDMLTHPNDANRRLTDQAQPILMLPKEEVPEQYLNQEQKNGRKK